MADALTIEERHALVAGYHEAHGAYLAAVVAELEDRGVAVDTWYTLPGDASDPRAGTIRIAGTATCVHGTAQLAVVWHEEHGWRLRPAQPAQTAAPGGLGVPLLADAEIVAEAIATALAGGTLRLIGADPHAGHRAGRADAAFERTLAAYQNPGR